MEGSSFHKTPKCSQYLSPLEPDQQVRNWTHHHSGLQGRLGKETGASWVSCFTAPGSALSRAQSIVCTGRLHSAQSTVGHNRAKFTAVQSARLHFCPLPSCSQQCRTQLTATTSYSSVNPLPTLVRVHCLRPILCCTFIHPWFSIFCWHLQTRPVWYSIYQLRSNLFQTIQVPTVQLKSNVVKSSGSALKSNVAKSFSV